MTTINSLSGGHTSSYLAVNFPADVEIFSMVCVENHNAGRWLKYNKSLLQYANEKLERYIPYYGEFKATAEDPIIIKTMMDLEQKIGREIIWVRGKSFEKMIEDQSVLPNQHWRFCTTYLKLIPIFEYCYPKFGDDVIMRLGIRYDELDRADTIDNFFEFPTSCNLYGQFRQNWETVQWRNVEFPLIENKVMHLKVHDFWNNNPDVLFAEDSNCQFCFWKDFQQLRKNFDNDRTKPIMQWAAVQEAIKNASFKKEMDLLQTAKIGLQSSFNFGTGAEGCKSGWCRG